MRDVLDRRAAGAEQDDLPAVVLIGPHRTRSADGKIIIPKGKRKV